MALRIQNDSFWDISPEFLLDSRFRFDKHEPATKFVYLPDEEVLVLGVGRETPSHKALMSSYQPKVGIDTSRWVRGIVLREKRIVYYRQGVVDEAWYDRTTSMLREHGLPPAYSVLWGPEAKRGLKDDLEGYP